VPELEFKIRGARGDLVVRIAFVPQLRAFTGVGRQDADEGGRRQDANDSV